MVCERVGNNFVMTAVLNPSATNPNAARSPAPPIEISLILVVMKNNVNCLISSAYQLQQQSHRKHDRQLCIP